MKGFMDIYFSSIQKSLTIADKTRFLQHFYRSMAETSLNPRQIKVLGKMLEAYPEEFAGGLTNRKYVSMTNTSSETAKRDLRDLLEKKMIQKGDAEGRSTYYLLNTGF
jgi:Fic family protein